MTRFAAALLLALSTAAPRLSAQTLTITNATVGPRMVISGSMLAAYFALEPAAPPRS